MAIPLIATWVIEGLSPFSKVSRYLFMIVTSYSTFTLIFPSLALVQVANMIFLLKGLNFPEGVKVYKTV